jgi:hypothetical protein
VLLGIVVAVGVVASPASAAERTARVVSTSGVLHADVADYRRSAWWRTGMPRGINGSWRTAIDTVIGQIASERPDAVLHTGDMVEGRWGVDIDDVGVFGAVDTFTRQKRGVRRAANLYYTQAKEHWARHGLSPLYAIGDHEVGDVGRSGEITTSDFRYRGLSAWRYSWAKHFTGNGTRFDRHPPSGQQRNTAYASVLGGGNVGLVTLDPIAKWHDGTHVRISGVQLRWLDETLAEFTDRGVEHLIVQCEVPALGPNREFGTSSLELENADDVWDVLVAHDVDLLLSGEFHDMTTHTNGGAAPVQVVHGGTMRHARANYLVIDVFDDGHIELALRRMSGEVTGTGRIRAPGHVRAWNKLQMTSGAEVVGAMRIGPRGAVTDRSGFLEEGV